MQPSNDKSEGVPSVFDLPPHGARALEESISCFPYEVEAKHDSWRIRRTGHDGWLKQLFCVALGASRYFRFAELAIAFKLVVVVAAAGWMSSLLRRGKRPSQWVLSVYDSLHITAEKLTVDGRLVVFGPILGVIANLTTDDEHEVGSVHVVAREQTVSLHDMRGHDNVRTFVKRLRYAFDIAPQCCQELVPRSRPRRPWLFLLAGLVSLGCAAAIERIHPSPNAALLALLSGPLFYHLVQRLPRPRGDLDPFHEERKEFLATRERIAAIQQHGWRR